MTLGEMERVRASIVYDDGQNVYSDLLEPCPFCGCEHGRRGTNEGTYVGPYVQVGPFMGINPKMVDARVVCGRCHVSTSRSSANKTIVNATDENVTRLVAIAKAIADWNRRA